MLIVLVSITLFIVLRSASDSPIRDHPNDFFIGVTFSSNTTVEAKVLIDKVKDYTNLLVVASGPVSKNETSLDEICNYAVNQGLHLIVYFGNISLPWQIPWISSAQPRWGSYFVGVYHYDEPAGSLLDTPNAFGNSSKPANYDEMANLFVNSWQTMPGLHTIKAMPNPPTTFTSDYALYWFDYLAGYDVILSEFGWNNSRAQQIALLRGAANLQNKSWGVIVTWTYDKAPYLESGDQLYSDLTLAYQNGAKYIMVFNYPSLTGNSYGDLTWITSMRCKSSGTKSKPIHIKLIFQPRTFWFCQETTAGGCAPQTTLSGGFGDQTKNHRKFGILHKHFWQIMAQTSILYMMTRVSLPTVST